MHLTEKLHIQGDHSLLLPGLKGQIEAILSVPPSLSSPFIAFLGHPHSLQGGTMNNKVVTTMARAFKELGIASLRFNFRGVGLSAGTYDQGIGESQDMLALVNQWQEEKPNALFIFAGFSFGSYVTYRAAAQHEHALLISVAPAVTHYNYKEFSPPPSPWTILQGNADEIVPYDKVCAFAKKGSIPIIDFTNTGHFFHGKLIELKEQIMNIVFGIIK